MRNGWEETNLGKVFRLSNRKIGTTAVEPIVFSISKYLGVVLASDYFDHRIASLKLENYKILAPGDWLYSTIHIDEGSIAVNHLEVKGVVSPMYTTLKWSSNSHLSSYFELLLRMPLTLGVYRDNAQGSINRRRSLPYTKFSELKFAIPPLEEQRRIVNVVESVDAYIAALQERVDAARIARNAVLHELLNAGGDGWVETTLGEVAKFVGERLSPTTIDSETYYVGLEHIVPHTLKVLSTGRTAEVTSHVTPFSEGDVLFGRLRPYLHKVAIADFAGFCSPEILVLRANKKCLPSLLHMFCDRESTIKSCVEMSAGTRMPRTSQGDLARVEISLPPLVEQQRIVEVVSSMDDSIQATEQTIVEAKNLRSGLLSDLLSGEHEIPAAYDKLLGAA